MMRRWSLALAAAAWSGAVDAQISAVPYSIERWTMEDGLPQNSVNAVVQTRDGYLWLGTNGGLVRFDGVEFTTYQPRTTPGLVGSRVYALLEDSRGDLWIGTQFGGVSRLRKGVFEGFPSREGQGPWKVFALAEDHEGHIWAGGSRFTNGRFVQVHARLDAANSLVVDRDGALWAGTGGAVFVVRDGVAVPLRSGAHTVALDARGHAWFQHAHTPMRWGDGRVHSWSPGETKLNDFAFADGRMIVVGDSGVFELSAELGWPPNPPMNPPEPAPFTRLPGAEDVRPIESLCVDRRGDLWLGTSRDGLVRLRRPPSRPVWSISYGKCLVAPDREGGVWLAATRSSQIIHVLRDGTLERRPSPSAGYASSLLVTRDGALCVLAGRNLYRESREGVIATELPVSAGDFCPVVEDAEGRIWIAIRSRLLVVEGQPARCTEAAGFVPGRRIGSLATSSDGSLWVGSHSRLLRLRDGEWTTFSREDGLPTGMVRSIHEARDGTLWLGSYGGGLIRVEEGGGFSAFTMEDGLPDDHVSQILESADGHLWLHGNLGLTRVPLAVLAERSPGGGRLPLAHVETVEADGATGALLVDGRLYVPTIEGVFVTDTTRIRSVLPPPVIVECVVAGTELIAARSGIEVPPEGRRLTFEFTSPALRESDQVRFRYRLSGLHEDWLVASSDRVALYETVPPGRYRFEVAAFNAAGATEPTTVSLEVVARWHETTAFRVAAAFAILALGLSISWWRTREVRRHNVQLTAAIRRSEAAEAELRTNHDRLRGLAHRLVDAQEAERKRIARELHDHSSQQLASLSMDLAILRSQSTDGAEQAELDSLAKRSRQIAGDLHGVARRLHSAMVEDLGLRSALESELESFSRHNAIQVESDVRVGAKGELPDAVTTPLFRIAQEGLRNVEKHARATAVRLAVHVENGQAVLQLDDNGIGFDPEQTSTGLGLESMRERVLLLQGSLSVESRPRHGTHVRVRLPLRQAAG